MKILRAFIFVFFLISNFAFGMVKEPFKFWSYEPNGHALTVKERSQWLDKISEASDYTFPRLKFYSIPDFKKMAQLHGIFGFWGICVKSETVWNQIEYGNRDNEFVQFFDKWIPGLIEKFEALDKELRDLALERLNATTPPVFLCEQQIDACGKIAAQLRGPEISADISRDFQSKKYDLLFDLHCLQDCFERIQFSKFSTTKLELDDFYNKLVSEYSKFVEIINISDQSLNGVSSVVQTEESSTSPALLCLGGAAIVAAVGGGSYAVLKYFANEKKDALVADYFSANKIYKIIPDKHYDEDNNLDVVKLMPIDFESGFIHAAFGNQVSNVLKKFFVGNKNVLVLELNQDILSKNGIQVCREQNKPGGEYFPHLYGKQQIPADAVKAVFKVQENADKNWIVAK